MTSHLTARSGYGPRCKPWPVQTSIMSTTLIHFRQKIGVTNFALINTHLKTTLKMSHNFAENFRHTFPQSTERDIYTLENE